MSAHILVIEDEPKLAALLQDYLVAAGLKASVLRSGAAAVEWISAHGPDAVLLDLMLPGQDGLTICRRVREFSSVPILMLTARVEDIDRLLGFEFGADDYVCKPFNPAEVVARVKAVLRRARALTRAEPRPVELDEERFEVRVLGQPMVVTPVEFRLLRRLMSQPGRVFSRQQVIEALYVDHRVVGDRTVDSHVRNLRRKFAEHGFDPIDAVYGVGYRFDWPDADDAAAPSG